MSVTKNVFFVIERSTSFIITILLLKTHGPMVLKKSRKISKKTTQFYVDNLWKKYLHERLMWITES